jgi:hypothetical protein
MNTFHIDHTVNQPFYLEVLMHLCYADCLKQSRQWQSGAWQMHHESTQLHSAQLAEQSLAKPPYFSEMAPCDFILFALIKKTLRGKLFEDVETKELNATFGDPKNRV